MSPLDGRDRTASSATSTSRSQAAQKVVIHRPIRVADRAVLIGPVNIEAEPRNRHRTGSIWVQTLRGGAAPGSDRADFLGILGKDGEPGRNRTFNQQIKSLLLCQLSYGPTTAVLERRGTSNFTTNHRQRKTAKALLGPTTSSKGTPPAERERKPTRRGHRGDSARGARARASATTPRSGSPAM